MVPHRVRLFFLIYRDQAVYSAAPQPAAVQQQLKGGPPTVEGIQVVQSKMAEPGFMPVVYDSSGRQVYYTTAAGGVVPAYQAAAAMVADGRQGGGQLNQEAGKAAAAAAKAPTQSTTA